MTAAPPPPSTLRSWPVGDSKRHTRPGTRLIAVAILAAAGARCHGEEHADLPPSFSIKPEMYATGFEMADGPTFDSAGSLYAVNYRGNGKIGRITRDGLASVWCDLAKIAPCEGRQPLALGLKVDGEGSIVAADAGGGRLLRISPDGTRADVLADRHQGSRFTKVNDVAISANQLYFTDTGAAGDGQPVGAVYRYDSRSRSVVLLANSLSQPAGVAVTPDGKSLCVSESGSKRILIFDFSETGDATNRRTLVEFPRENQGNLRGGLFPPEGMIFDKRGRLYVTMGTGGIINVVEVPSGKIIRQYDTGGKNATNCHFFEDALYVTVADGEAVFRLKLGVAGFPYR